MQEEVGLDYVGSWNKLMYIQMLASVTPFSSAFMHSSPFTQTHTHACTCTNALLLSSSIIPPLFLHALPLHHCLPPLLCNLPGIPIPHLPRLPLFYPTPSLSLSLLLTQSFFLPASSFSLWQGSSPWYISPPQLLDLHRQVISRFPAPYLTGKQKQA